MATLIAKRLYLHDRGGKNGTWVLQNRVKINA